MIAFTLFFHQMHREWLLHSRKPLAMIQPWMFFIMVMLLFPFILSQEIAHLGTLLPGLIWITALFAYLLSISAFFELDETSGALETLLIYPFPLSLSILAKIMIHWLLTGLPLTLLSSLLGCFIGLSNSNVKIVTLSLLLGTPALSALGALLGAITISLASRGLLLALLLIPLSLPILIFGIGSVLAESIHASPASSLSFLSAITLTALLGSPFASAAALRLNNG